MKPTPWGYLIKVCPNPNNDPARPWAVVFCHLDGRQEVRGAFATEYEARGWRRFFRIAPDLGDARGNG